MDRLLNLIASAVTPKVRNIFFILGAVVIVAGALFKANHWQGAPAILIAGMAIEAVILILSAIPQPEE